MSVSLEDGTIHARSEAKVIGVNDQTAHRVSLAGRRKGAMQRESLSSEFGREQGRLLNGFRATSLLLPQLRFWL